METRDWTDLTTALSNWRASLIRHGLWPGEIDELQEHLLARMDELAGRGESTEAAFSAAVDQMGDPEAVAAAMREGRRPRDLRGRVDALLESVGGALALNYVRVVFRALRRDRGFAFISISGLSVGIAICALLAAYVRHELQFDAMHERADRVYRVAKGSRATTPGLWGPELQTVFPDVEAAVRIMDNQFGNALLVVADTEIPAGAGLVADEAFFDVFSYALAIGNPSRALREPGSVVLDPGLADALFGAENPVGQSLTVSGGGDFPSRFDLTVTGLLEEPAGPSHLQFRFVVSMATVDALDRTGEWGTPFSFTNAFVKTYVLLRPGADPDAVASGFPQFIDDRVASERYLRHDVFLQPLTSIHLRSRLRFDPPGSGGIQSLYLMLLVAALVLGIAVANFVNLAVARSMQRGREIALRKVVGAGRGQLVTQFLGESILIALVAAVLAVPLAILARPTFETLVGRPLPTEALLGDWVLLFLPALALLVGLASGAWPAFLLSRHRPAEGLRARPLATGRGLSRRVLVAGELAVSMALIAVTVLFARQMDFIGSQDLGYDPADVIVIRSGHSEAVSGRADEIAGRLQLEASIRSAATSHSIPSSFLNEFSYVREGADVEERVQLGSLSIGRGVSEAFGLRLLAGRFITPDAPQDSVAFVVNQAAAARLGFNTPMEAVGQRIDWLMSGPGFSGPIAGVVADMHFGSLREAVPPMVFHLSSFGVGYLIVKPEPGGLAEALQAARTIWTEVEHAHPFAYELLETRIDAQYASDQRLARTIGIGSAIAILLACLGLIGLVAFMAERRRRELGVRQTLGASTLSLVLLFAREFVGGLGVAFAVAGPIAYLAMQRWLDGFAYHVDAGMLPLVVGLAVTAAAAFGAIALKTASAACLNPVRSLRTE